MALKTILELEHTAKILSKSIIDLLVESDHYFQRNIHLTNLVGSPRFYCKFENTSATGSVTYVNENNTYWSPSFMIMAKNVTKLNSVLSRAMTANIELLKMVSHSNFKPIHEAYVHKAFGSHEYTRMLDSEIGKITHLSQADDQGKQDSYKPYIIEKLNLTAIEEAGGNLFLAAYMGQSIFGHFDLFDVLMGNDGQLWQMLDIARNELEIDEVRINRNYNLNLALNDIVKRLGELDVAVRADHEHHLVTDSDS